MGTGQNGRPDIAFPSRVGVWWNGEAWPIGEASEVARDIERMGYGSLFFGEAFGKESLTQAGAFLTATERLVVGTGIANIHARDPIAAEVGGRTLAALHPGRFVLGLGVSHGPLVEGGRGGSYSKPLATMRDYLRRMDDVPDELEPGGRPARLLAALGPKMIELAGAAADGAHPAYVLPEQTTATRAALGPDKWVVVMQAVAVTDVGGVTEADALRRARAVLGVYSAMPNYQMSWRRQGFDEVDVVDGGSERLARAFVGIGDPDTAGKSVRAHLDAGADHVVVQVLGDAPTDDPRPALEALAAAL
ncbi:TIGR03620 family F420-dependent LLM class oxidoreductase [Pseudonocardia zijingensis]|uniref:LLM class F420-dependent oxidoreductase n=1 Tax=Pseudonocardia zijingensis TaxID=153376 RepID=A0ABN1NKY8_9PSEU